MNKFKQIIAQTHQALNDLETNHRLGGKQSEINDLIQLEETLQSLARQAHDAASERVKLITCKCKCTGTFHRDDCPLSVC